MVIMSDGNIKLNLGCGKDIKKVFQNFDKYPISDCVNYIDLDKLPLPFKDESIEYIFMEDTFEHLHCDRLEFMKEIKRILKKDGVFKVIVPSSTVSVDHTVSLFDTGYFNSITSGGNKANECYYDKWFDVVKLKKNTRTLRAFVWKMKKMIEIMIFGSFDWELRKI